MKKTTAVFLIFFAIYQNTFSQDFYDINSINTIEILFNESNWDQILDQFYAAGDEERLTGMAYINGVQYDSIGVRYKGNSTYNPNQIKNPLNIKLDYLIDDQTIDGYGTLKLANVYKDPSFVREVLSYEIAREYMPASKANFITVFINGTYLGLYSSVQSVDKFFMGNHFNSNENSLFKGELANDSPTNPVTVWGYLGADSGSYYDFYELKSDAGWLDLVEFLDGLNNDTENVADFLNVDRHLWMLAFDILLVNLDAPVNFAHNYYLYKDDAGQFNPVIWDLNESFGVFSMLLGQSSTQLNASGLQQLDPFLNSTSSDYPIVSKILANPTYKKMYVAHVKTMLEEIFSNGWYKTRALEIQSIIDYEVQIDPNKFYTYADFLSNIDNTVGQSGPPRPGLESIIGITELMESRKTFLNAQVDFMATEPTISNITHSPTQVSAQSEVCITAEIQEATSVTLAWRNSISERFVKTVMLDDGIGCDNQAGDGIYSASVTAGATELQYYIYAENSDAAKFSPQRAAYDYYTLSVSAGYLVINEFMADNDSVVPDQDGEYDDWIELYNNSNTEISLNGHYLSDDGNDLTQWTFPDTIIAANGYLIIWADDNEDQAGLHANFKLSKSGEAIYLCSQDTLIVDEITFAAQATDLSSGRYPNGSGSFTEMTPSFGAENQVPTSLVGNESSSLPANFVLEQNYPNPFNPLTTISFTLPAAGRVSVKIYNIAGQLVTTLVEGQLSQGKHSYQWQAENRSSGIYFYTLSSGSFSETKRMLLVK